MQKIIPSDQDLTGKVFGRLTVLSYSHSNNYGRVWNCLCECGESKQASTVLLNRGTIRSCGCLAREVSTARLRQIHNNQIINKAKDSRCSVCDILETETSKFYYDSIYGQNLCNKHYLQLRKRGKILSNTRLSDTEIRIKDEYAEVAIRDTYGNEVSTAIIDIDDIDLVSRYKWHLSHGYAKCKNEDISISMHELIMGIKNEYILDHINGNRMDNRKENLRHATLTHNAMNKGFQSNNKSGIVGVSWRKDKQKWYSTIEKNGKSYMKTFYDVLDAMKYRLLYEIDLFKEHRRKSNWDRIGKSNFIICIINDSNLENTAISDYLISNLKRQTKLSINDSDKKDIKYDYIEFINYEDLNTFYYLYGYRVISIHIGSKDTKHVDKLGKNKKPIINFVTSVDKTEDCANVVDFIEKREKEISIFSELKGVDNIEKLPFYRSFIG